MNKPQLVEEAKVPESFTDEEKAKQLPIPVGWRILCVVPEFDAKFDGSQLVRPQTVVEQEQFATVVLFVLKMGVDCYTDKKRYPNGAWCKEGDFIIARQYSGTRFRIYGKEFRLLNEDQIEAVVQDPRGISRA
jgi:co-chaperonin GroES (HSP10)